MKVISSCVAAALVAVPTALAASGTPAPRNSGPAPVNYICSDGHEASVVYESGSDFQHAKAIVSHEGRTIEMRAAPTLYGVRYRAEAAEGGAPLAWSLRGEEAWLTEAPDADSYTRQEQAIARCIRLRGAAPVQTASADSHGEDHRGQGEDH
ncbi:MAG TPA: MliC family protein [Allosphingosinicella sp.]|jgi:hypothetical protein